MSGWGEIMSEENKPMFLEDHIKEVCMNIQKDINRCIKLLRENADIDYLPGMRKFKSATNELEMCLESFKKSLEIMEKESREGGDA